MASIERHIAEAFQDQGLRLAGDAMSVVSKFIESVPETADPQIFLDELVTKLLEKTSNTSLVSKDLAAEVIGVWQRALESAEEGGPAPTELPTLLVVDAFTVPKFTYDLVRKQFCRVPKPPRLFASPEAKSTMYRERFALLQQRISRNKLFSRPALGSAGPTDGHRYCELTPLQALLGTAGEQHYVMGSLSQLEDGRFYLEDLTASIQVDLSTAATTAGLFTENCIVVAEGTLNHHGVFEVSALGFPPAEKREETRAVTVGLDFFGGGCLRASEREQLERLSAESPDDMIVVLADVWLDKPEVAQGLRTVLGGFADAETPPVAFVLMGDFQSSAFGPVSANLGRMKDAFSDLADMIEEFPTLAERSRFLIVPGPGDVGPSAALPRPALPKSLAGGLLEVPTVQLVSNPCRLRWFDQEIVLFRDDLGGRMRRGCVRPPQDEFVGGEEDENTGGEAPPPETNGQKTFKHLAATLMQQAHLAPLPLQHASIYWEWDHALFLYPAPHAVLLADRTLPQATTVFGESDTLLANTGSFGTDGSFAVYRASTRQAEISGVDLKDVPRA